MKLKIPPLALFMCLAIALQACQPQRGVTPVMIRSATPPPPTPIPETPVIPLETLAPSSTFLPGPTDTPTPSGQRVAFTAGDGRQLVGYFYPAWKSNAPVVVLMHQFQSNQRAWLESGIIAWMQNWRAIDPSNPPYFGSKLPEMPHDLSFAVFTFDFRGHGESLPPLEKPDVTSNVAGFLLDAQAAYATAMTMPGVDPSQVIGIGASIGADAVVDACAEWCIGAFSVSPGSWLNVDYSKAVQALLDRETPVRCMYSDRDPPTPDTCLSLTQSDLYKVYGYKGIKHGMTFFVPRKMEANFGENLLEFLQAASNKGQ